MAMIDTNRISAKAIHVAGAFVCAALLGVAYFTGAQAVFAGDAQPDDRSEQLHAAESDASLKAAAVDRLEREVAHALQELDDKPMSLIPASAMNQRLAHLSGLAQEHELTLASSQPGQETRLAYYAFVPIAVGGDGRLGDFVRFLGALHERFPDMGVRAFDITRDPAGGGRFTLTLSWYVQPTRTADAL